MVRVNEMPRGCPYTAEGGKYSMYAVIEACGKQYKVSEGDKIRFEKLNAEEGAEVVFDKVLLLGKDDGVAVGAPYVEGAKVTGKVLENGRDKKVIVFKYRRKKNYRKFRGHRQYFTTVEISAIA